MKSILHVSVQCVYSGLIQSEEEIDLKAASAAMRELVRFTGGDDCPPVSQSVGWCFRAVSSWGDNPALLTLQQRERTEVNTLLLIPLSYVFLLSCPLFCLSSCAITQPDTLLSNSRHLVRQVRRTSRVWWRQQRKRKRASVVATVCVRQDCPSSSTSTLNIVSLLSWICLVLTLYCLPTFLMITSMFMNISLLLYFKQCL